MPLIPQRKRIFLGCEGKSERAYGIWLQFIADELRPPLYLHIDTFVPGHGGGDPYDVVKGSIDEIRRRERLHGKYTSRGILLDSDRLNENPDRDRWAFDAAKRNSVVLIFQEFDHEALLLRHFPSHERDRPPRGQSERILRTIWPDYRKPMTSQDLYKKISLLDLQRVCAVENILRNFLNDLNFPV